MSLTNDTAKKRFDAAGLGTWAVTLVNGALGDYLHERNNGLAVEMAFYADGQPLALERAALLRCCPAATPKVVILVHGLGCNERLWDFTPPGQPVQPRQPANYGSLLQAELGYTPFYVRYNTGLSVAENGQKLAQRLSALWDCYPLAIEEMLCIGHSMGGLVLRSACYYGTQHQAPWVAQVRHVFYLGTPHDGANLEKVAHASTVVLDAVANSITKLVSDVINLRSQGIKDLRYGTLLAPDVLDEGSEEPSHHARRAVPWLTQAQHYLVAGTLTADPDHIVAVLLGDGLVSKPRQTLAADGVGGPIPEANVCLLAGVGHLQLAHEWAVYQQLKRWLTGAAGPVEARTGEARTVQAGTGDERGA